MEGLFNNWAPEIGHGERKGEDSKARLNLPPVSHIKVIARRKLRQEQEKVKVNLMKLLLNNVVEIITWKIPILFSKKQQDGNIMLLSSGVFQL